MEKYTFVDLLATLGFFLALVSIAIGLRVMVFGKYQTKDGSKPSVSEQPRSTKP